MRVTAATFVGAATTARMLPAAGPPEIAVAGRSNVGKSSFLNALLGRRGLARTSRTPGRTRQVNFFEVNGRFRMVDLPGYGYAVGPAAERRAWGPLVEGYLRRRETLCGVIVLADVRRGPEREEHQLHAFLERVGVASALVVTKLDKLGRGPAQAALRAIAGEWPGPVLGFSARTGAGRAEVWRLVQRWLDAAASLRHRGGR